jgi:hypothetical protein
MVVLAIPVPLPIVVDLAVLLIPARQYDIVKLERPKIFKNKFMFAGVSLSAVSSHFSSFLISPTSSLSTLVSSSA